MVFLNGFHAVADFPIHHSMNIHKPYLYIRNVKCSAATDIYSPRRPDTRQQSVVLQNLSGHQPHGLSDAVELAEGRHCRAALTCYARQRLT